MTRSAAMVLLLLLTTRGVVVNGNSLQRQLKMKNLRRQPTGRQGMQRKCRHDGNCPRVECVTTPCYQQVCLEGECVPEEPPIVEQEEEEQAEEEDERGGNGRMGCQTSRNCPQLRCAVGYACPRYVPPEKLQCA